jgi:SAM-dependent methyltransferase
MDHQVYRRMAAIEDEQWWFVARRRILASVLSSQSGLPRPARILEAGSGTGGNLRMLSWFGQVMAFEPDSEARALARRRGPFDVRAGWLPDEIPFDPGSFDLIAALDVLEHLDDDEAALRALAAQLRSGGMLLVTVPAFPFLWSKHDDEHHHRRRYGRKVLVDRVFGAGFTPIYVTFFNTFLFPLVAGVRLCKAAFGLHGMPDDTSPPHVVNRSLTAVFASERHLLGRVRFPFGVSLLLLARKASN